MLGPQGSPPTSTRVMYWKTERQTCHQTSMRVRLPSDTNFLVLALRYRNTPESSTCMIFRKPFTPDGQLQVRLSSGERVTISMPPHLKEGRNSSHIFAFHWDSDFLELSVDDKSIATILLTAEQSIEPWVRSAALCLASSTDFVESFQVEALPFKYMTSFGYPTCAYCSRESLGCCSGCEHWFCQRHGVMGTDVCLACVPEYYLEDRLGGSSVQVTPSVRLQIEKRRLQALCKQYLRFQGDQVGFEQLCHRMVTVEDVLSVNFSNVQPPMESAFFSVAAEMDRPSGTGSLFDFALDAFLPRSVRQWTGLSILDVLSIVHPHPRDAHLQFRDLDHSYTWQGRKVSLSVTGLIHKLAQSFNALEALRAASNAQRSQSWPRVDYLVANAVSELRRVLREEGLVEAVLQQFSRRLALQSGRKRNLHVTMQRQYFYPKDIRCRRYITEVGTQSVSPLTRAICCPHTADYDISAAMFNIVVQLCDMVEPTGLDIPSWRAVATSRSRVCSDQLKCTESIGKKILTEVANGATPSSFTNIAKQGLTVLTALSTESRFLRWLACSQLQTHYVELRRGSRNHWPEASIFALWWTVAENLILQSMTRVVRQGEVAGHVSCHFDGILIARSLVQSIEESAGKSMISLLEENVLEQTRFKVTIKDKTVPSLDELLDSRLKPSQVDSKLSTYAETLTAISNSIPAALVFLGADLKQIILRLREESPANTKAETRHVRQYSDWNGCGDLHLLPRSVFTAEADSDFLLHLELPDSSFCMGVKVLPANTILVMRGGRVYEGSMSNLMDLLKAFHGIKETFCFDIVSEPAAIDDTNSGFLDLLAGSSDGRTSKKRPAAQTHAVQTHGPQNEGEIDVGAELMNLMKREIEEAMDNVNCQDAITGKEMQPYFLSRAAAIMRSDVKPPVPTKIVEVDSYVRYVFDKDGPIIMALHTIKRRHDLRRVGNFYYTYAFACAFLQVATAANGSLHKICSSFLRSCKRHDGQISSLLPRSTNSFWINVFEDLMNAPPVLAYRDTLLQECHDHDEFHYLSIDATFKVNLKIIEDEAAYRTLTCRDRTGAAVLIGMVRSEKASVIADSLASRLSLAQRTQVQHVASDTPSVEMFRVLKQVLPRLESIALDAMHIIMVYQQNMGNKKTHGSRWLAVIMDKLRLQTPDMADSQ
ncbi:unnamed protein product, partial [Symbiodinium sp. KB8]